MVGSLTFDIQTGSLSNNAGPIIRINSFEPHIDDPDYYEKLHSREGR
jgi:hypothetical protein